jgi:serine/threonine-protein kinase RsbT
MMRSVETAHSKGILIVARDNGPGIRSIQDVLRDGYSTSGGLGLGLPGVRRLMDEFAIESELKRGTTVTVKKWLK